MSVKGNKTEDWSRELPLPVRGYRSTFFSLVTGKLYRQIDKPYGTNWIEEQEGVPAFLDLLDTPADYTAGVNYLVQINATQDGLDFVDPATLGGGATPDLDAVMEIGSIADVATPVSVTSSSDFINRYTNGTVISEVKLDILKSKLSYTAAAGTIALELRASASPIFTDTVFSKGLDYAADYSANYTARTLVDKAYVDGLTATPPLTDVVTAGNTLADGQTIEALNGGGYINLRDTANNLVSITTDGPAFAESYIFMDPTTANLFAAASGAGFAADATGISLQVNSGFAILIKAVSSVINIAGAFRPAFQDDIAAGVGGLVAGDIYQTDGAGAAPLNVAGIMMIKQ